MGQYTDKVNAYMEIMEYIEQGNKCSALEAQAGRLTTWFNHGGMSVEILRDGVVISKTSSNTLAECGDFAKVDTLGVRDLADVIWTAELIAAHEAMKAAND